MKHIFVFLISILLSYTQLWAQSSDLPVIQHFAQEEYMAHPQNYCAIQDNRGILYIGNNDGLLEFDAWTWRIINTNNQSGVRCLAIDSTGIIFIGANEDFGYLTYSKNGTTVFHSLLTLLPDSLKNISIIWKVFANNKHVFFLGSEAVYVYDYKEIKKIDVLLMPQYGFIVNNTLCLFTENGISYLDKENKLKALENTEWLYDNNIIVPVELNNKYIFFGDISGIFFSSDKNFPFSDIYQIDIPNKTLEFLENKIPYTATKLHNNNIAIGSLAGGILIIDTKGNPLSHIDREKGLADNTVIGLFSDNMGNCWALLNNGINVLFYNKPLSVIGHAEGIESAVMAVSFHKGNQFIGTYSSILIKNTKTSTYQEITKFPGVCWTFLNTGEKLYASYEFEILEIDSNKYQTVYTGNTSYSLGVLKEFDDIIFAGQDGLIALQNTDNQLIEAFNFPETKNTPIRKIEEDHLGRLWVTTEFNGIFVYSFNNSIENYQVQHLDTTHGLPSMLNNYMNMIGDRVMIASPKGIREAITTKNKNINIIIPSDFEKQFVNGNIGITQLIESKENIIWANTSAGIGKFSKNKNTYKFKKIIPINIVPDAFRIFLFDNTLYIGTGKNLFTYNTSFKERDYNFPVFIRKIKINNDSLIFNGAYTQLNSDSLLFAINTQGQTHPEFTYKFNNIAFEFSGFSYEKSEANTYSYFLEGYDETFSNWSNENKKEYTNLPEGEYTFHVKCKNVYDEISPESVYHFTILPPWYRSWWAYLLYIVSGIIIIFFIVRINSIRLRKANIKLEKTVQERTAVIALQKKEITDSIKYAGKIQRSVLPSADSIKNILPEFFIVNLAKDIVSGDFYWIGEQDNAICFTVADCTGHGVPGAFMSMLGISSLNQLLAKMPNASPDQYLNELRKTIISSLHQKGESGENADGMDMAFCRYFPDKKTIEFTGAQNPLWIIRNKECIILKGDKMPIGVYYNSVKSFNLQTIEVKSGDLLYLFSDGFADQFGGPKGKKYMSKNFREFLISISDLPLNQQKTEIIKEFEHWINYSENNISHPRMDDIMIMGVKL